MDNHEWTMLVKLTAKVDALADRMAESARLREEGATRAREAEQQIWYGIEALRTQHDHFAVKLASIETKLEMAGSPVRNAERLTAMESADSAVRWILSGLAAAIVLVVASLSGLIGSVIQALGGNPSPKAPGG